MNKETDGENENGKFLRLVGVKVKDYVFLSVTRAYSHYFLRLLEAIIVGTGHL